MSFRAGPGNASRAPGCTRLSLLFCTPTETCKLTATEGLFIWARLSEISPSHYFLCKNSNVFIWEPGQPGQPRSRPPTISFVKIPMCSYENRASPVNRDLGLGERDLGWPGSGPVHEPARSTGPARSCVHMSRKFQPGSPRWKTREAPAYKLKMEPHELISIVPLVVELSFRVTLLLQLNCILLKWKIQQINQNAATEGGR